ncbi:MAG: sigma-70 family RNA polymerase sigma factor [Verrucomicrobiota bacterium]|nr:sigma-70 family RNA polymerase sigma factor [Verrucomicrobiota bacterium]
MRTEAERATTLAEDSALVARCQKGDTAAFDELVTKYRGKMYAMIFNMVRREQDAWDLAQDGFVKAWKSIGRFRGQSAFYTWLYRIMMNVTIDWMRKRQIEGATEFDESVAHESIDPAASTAPRPESMPHEHLGRREIGARIDAAIQKLSPEHRAVILMKEIEGLQYHEIAEAIDCSIGTVMSRLFYARKKLQGLLKDVYENV